MHMILLSHLSQCDLKKLEDTNTYRIILYKLVFLLYLPKYCSVLKNGENVRCAILLMFVVKRESVIQRMFLSHKKGIVERMTDPPLSLDHFIFMYASLRL